ncbi:MAG TPA: hypothetical protein PKN95_10900 [Verrucomicrobiota bacterium]|nr:hypothetical protein [Verrucomicrobiota bacterium]HNT16222.1 hypothetical protein [Verrucomicrobiota bacterium]
MNLRRDPRPAGEGGFPPLVRFNVLLFLVLAVLFGSGWRPGYLVFSNDAPLGALHAEYHDIATSLTGTWADLNWLGLNGGLQSISITNLLLLLLRPVVFSKVFAPIALCLVGNGARFLCRRLGFSELVGGVVGLAAALNGDFMATACWGVANQPICFALGYFALGVLVGPRQRPWARVMLAGLLVGMGVVEASDIGAMFSIFIAAWVVAHALAQEGAWGTKLLLAAGRLLVVAAFAGFIAANAVSSLVATQIKGVVGMAQDEQTRAQRWSEATQWSLPKREALDIVVPGFFGFRMDTPLNLPPWAQKWFADGSYWGFAGRGPEWDTFLQTDRQGPLPGNFFRYGMGAGYAGILVLLVAGWALGQALRGGRSFFSGEQRKMIGFWLAVLLVSTAFMFGRFAPFYQFLYALPYASMFRNPAKFLHVFSWALIVLFAYGLHGLTTLYLDRATATTRGAVEQFRTWWKTAAGFDRRWVTGLFLTLGGVGLVWIGLIKFRGALETYAAGYFHFLSLSQGENPDPGVTAGAAARTISFSLGQYAWTLVFVLVSVAFLALLTSGAFAGKRRRFAGMLLGLLVVVDLGWQAQPWVIAQNWTGRYVEAAQNPVFDLLRDRPYERRVGNVDSFYLRAFQLDPRLVDMESMFQSVYGSEWTQHLFPYYNIQSINVVQMPRRPLDYDVFETAFRFWGTTSTLAHVTRRWQLTSTRYIAAAAPLVGLLNQGFDAAQQRFQVRLPFDFYQNRPGGPILIRTNENGRYAILEFTGALPRAKMYAHWETPAYNSNRVDQWLETIPPSLHGPFTGVATNDLATLALLASPNFDPAHTVLPAQVVPGGSDSNAPAGTVDYVSYHPKQIVLKTKSAAPNVLLLNDRYDPNWRVTIDGQPAELLRCNYLMRGVAVPAGEHVVEFNFQPDVQFLFVSLAAIALGLVLIGFLAVPGRTEPKPGAEPARPKPAKADAAGKTGRPPKPAQQ